MAGLIDEAMEQGPVTQYQIIGLDGKPTVISEQELASLDHSTLLRLRERNPDTNLQKLLAPYEHRAFAREATKENPLMAAPIAAATPLYAAAKGLGLIGGRSGAGNPLGQMKAGFTGVAEGLVGAARQATGL